MSEALPIGLPFYYTKNDGKFSAVLATDRTDWSREALDYINYLSFSKFEGQKIDCVINGERKITTNTGDFFVDGYIFYKGLSLHFSRISIC